MRKRKLKKRKAVPRFKHMVKRTYCLVEKPGSLLRRKIHASKVHQVYTSCRTEKSSMEVRPPNSLSCPICNMVFESNKRWNLERHMDLHSSHIEKYKCTSCGKMYSTKFNFKKHLPRAHSDENVALIGWITVKEKAPIRPIYPQNQSN